MSKGETTFLIIAGIGLLLFLPIFPETVTIYGESGTTIKDLEDQNPDIYKYGS